MRSCDSALGGRPRLVVPCGVALGSGLQQRSAPARPLSQALQRLQDEIESLGVEEPAATRPSLDLDLSCGAKGTGPRLFCGHVPKVRNGASKQRGRAAARHPPPASAPQAAQQILRKPAARVEAARSLCQACPAPGTPP